MMKYIFSYPNSRLLIEQDVRRPVRLLFRRSWKPKGWKGQKKLS